LIEGKLLVAQIVNGLAKTALLAGIVLCTSAWQPRPGGGAVGPLMCIIPHESISHTAVTPGRPDLSGTTRLGKASFYAKSFAHRLMADGRRMDPQGLNAASRTLPLGTTAKVTNLQTGQSAIVTIEDRGPYVKGRIVDLSPATARQIGITRDIGVARVKVAPISVRLPDGSVKPGSGVARVPICRVYTS
jgi:rare lipoprotein A